MRSFVRWSATLGLMGSAVFGTLLGFTGSAMALPQETIVQTLQPVPVFAVVAADGTPLVATVQPNNSSQGNQAQRNVAGVFISREDAQQFIENLKKENPQLASQVRVQPASLGEIYKLDRAQGAQSTALDFAYVPMPEQVQSAETILRQQGQQGEFNGVPLFVAKGGSEQGYLTLQQGDARVIPFFFEKEQLDAVVARFKQQQPNLANTVKIEVVPLEAVMATMEQSNDQQLSQIVLVPTRESLQFLQSLPQAQPNTPQRPR